MAAGGWVLRALHGAPAALGADTGAIAAVGTDSPHYRDGVFVNLEPSSMVSWTGKSSGCWSAICCWAGQRAGPTGRSRWPRPTSADAAADARRDVVRPFQRADRGRRLPSAGRPGVERAVFAVAHASGRSACIRCRRSWTHCPPSTRSSSAMTTTTTSTSTPIRLLARTQRCSFFVPLGVGAHLRDWRIPPDRIVELDWNEEGRHR